MNESRIDRLYSEGKALLDFLSEHKEYSFRNDADNVLKKNLLMAAASYFEKEIQNIILGFIAECSKNNILIVEFTKNKAIKRQYHTYFDWDAINANAFLGLFGKEFKDAVIKDVGGNEELKNSIKNFMELGQMRNMLTHNDFASYSLDKDMTEVYMMYKSARQFTDYLVSALTKNIK